MNETIYDIVVDLVSDGVSGLMGPVLVKMGGTLRDWLRGPSFRDGELDRSVSDAANGLAQVASFGDQRLKEFLKSPEVQGVVWELISANVLNEPSVSVSASRRKFVLYLSSNMGTPIQQVEKQGSLLFNNLLRCCETALSGIILRGAPGLSAHEAKSNFRHLMLRDMAIGISTRLDNLLECIERIDKWSLRESLSFEQEYRDAIARETSFILPPNADRQRPVSIGDLYVYPHLEVARKPRDYNYNMTVQEFMSCAYRSVILGDPGAGKSTLARKICHDLATQYGKRLFRGRALTPILITLRHYGEFKRSASGSILEFIESTANTDFQIPIAPGAIKYLLNVGRIMVVFDGLDELVDTADRQRVSRDVEHFCSRYPGVPIIVTSRSVGYGQAPLNDKVFEEYHLAPFDSEQEIEYARKWFRFGANLALEEGELRASTFIRESEHVKDLRSNPLMLSLMCYLYLGDNYIPENRPSLYRKCATWLFRQWDSSRRIPVPSSFEEHLEGTIQRMAHWIYSEPVLQDGVTEDTLIDATSEFLLHENYEDRSQARVQARHLIEYCKGRAWVFSDCGTNQAGEALYKFTHRTFLEYFTAEFITQEYYTPKALWEILRPRIENKEWDMVAQLAFQEHCRARSPSAREELFSLLLDCADVTSGRAKWNVLSFALRCLEFINPRPITTRRIVEACLKETFTHFYRIQISRRGRTPRQRSLGDLWSPIRMVSTHNRSPAAEGVGKWFEIAVKADSYSAALAVEILTYLLSSGRKLLPSSHDWDGVIARLLEESRDRIVSLASDFSWPRHVALYQGWLTVDQAMKLGGMRWTFNSYEYVCQDGEGRSARLSLVGSVWVRMLRGQYPGEPIDMSEVIEALGRRLLVAPTPWPALDPRMLHMGNARSMRLSPFRIPTSKEGVFGAFCVWAILSEAIECQDPIPVSPPNIQEPYSSVFDLLVASRSKDLPQEHVDYAVSELGLDGQYEEFVRNWITRKISLLRNRGQISNSKRRA